jgi:hypothetical protein
MRRLWLVLLVVALPALLVTGCSSSSPSSGSKAPVAAAGQNAAGAKAAGASADRQVVTDGSVDLTVTDPRETARAAAALVESIGGRVDARTEDAAAAGHAASAHLTLRIPANQVSTTVNTLEGMGTLQNLSLAQTDVTGTAQDLDARIGAMKISVQRLEDLMSKATTSADLVAAESALNDRQMQLESMQAQRSLLANQVDLATIRFGLYSPGEAPAKPVDGFWGGLVAGWNSLVDAVGAGLVVLGVLLPWLAFFGLLGFVGWLVVRQIRRWRPAKRQVSSMPPLPPSMAMSPLSAPPGPPYYPAGPPTPPIGADQPRG